MFEQQILDLASIGQFDAAANLTELNSVHSLLSASLLHSQAGNSNRAIQLAEMCIEIDPKNPEAYWHVACALGIEMRCQEAIEVLNASIALFPHSKYFYSKAMFLVSMKKVEESISIFEKAIEMDPDNSFIKFSLGCAQMTLGNYKKGLPLLENRFLYDQDLKKFKQRFDKPDWNGQDLNNKTLLMFSEQGLGDLIQYVRYVPWFRKYNCKIIAEGPQQLESLISHLFDEYIGRTPEYNIEEPPNLPNYDYIVSFASLPYLIDPELNNIPSAPYLHVNSKDLNLDKNKKNIGLVWAGNPLNSNDNNRSFPAKHFIPLKKDNIQLYSLQLGELKRSVDLSEGLDELNPIDLSSALVDMKATAEIITQLDLIITADTAIAHLAGALGVPVWTLLSFCHGYHWRLNQSKTAWYPTMTLFHQKTLGDWDGVIKEVLENL